VRNGCTHDDCWQCAEKRATEKVAVMASMVEKARRERNAQTRRQIDGPIDPLLRKSMTPGITVDRSFAQNQTTTISRTALERLCADAGLVLEWNGGDPIICHREEDGTLTGRKLVDANGVYAQEATSIPSALGDKRAREVLKAQGASDDDIEAAITVLGLQSPEEQHVD
jgi:hypothetical protein